MTDQQISHILERPQPALKVQKWRLGFFAALIAAELTVLSVTYTNNFTFTCRDVAPSALCEIYSLSVERVVFFLGVFLIFAIAQPSIPRLLSVPDNYGAQPSKWLWTQLTGFSLILLPWTFAADGVSRGILLLAFILWILGGALAAFGFVFALAPRNHWQKVVGYLGPVRLLVLGMAIFAPEIVGFAHGIWYFEPLTRATFNMVVTALDIFGVPATAAPEEFALATNTFAIQVGWQCSGVEGFALAGLFLLCYFYAFADDLRFPHVWVLLPFALAFSWILNVLRIAALFTIGDRISPNLAANGFHSHAGWLLFSFLALSIIGVLRTVPWFQSNRDGGTVRLTLRHDWMAARIVPFAGFMSAALFLSTLYRDSRPLVRGQSGSHVRHTSAVSTALFANYLES